MSDGRVHAENHGGRSNFAYAFGAFSKSFSSRSREGNSWFLVPNPHRHEERFAEPLEYPGQTLRVLIVDRDSMSSDLLATALTRDRNFHASGIRAADLLECMADGNAQVVVIGADLDLDSKNGFDLAQHGATRAPVLYPLLFFSVNRPSIQSSTPFVVGHEAYFPDSKQWPNLSLVSSMCSRALFGQARKRRRSYWRRLAPIPTPDLAMGGESLRLTLRELQVVKCAARGKTNKAIAKELRLSEHTVKNYLFRSFEKLGVSNRVELLFYLTQRGQTLWPRHDRISRDQPTSRLM